MVVCCIDKWSNVSLRNESMLYQFREEREREIRVTDLFDGVALESMKAAD
jgi:hypothetical protein